MTERVRTGIRLRDIRQKYTDYSGDPDDGARMKGEDFMDDLYKNGNGFHKERNVPERDTTRREESYAIARQDFDGIREIQRKQATKKTVKTVGLVAGSLALLSLTAWAGHRFWPGE